MDLQQFRYVLAVAEMGSFTRAAESCFVVQSALSHQIKALERELGVDLFARTSRRVALTAAGHAFVTAAREAIRAADRAAEEAVATAGMVSGGLVLGVNPTLTAVDVASTLRQYCATYPDVRISLTSDNSGELMNKTSRGEIDVTFLALESSQRPDGVAYRELAREPLDVVVWPGHPLSGRTTVDIEDIAGETFVDFPENTTGRVQADVAFSAAGIRRKVAFEVPDADLMAQLIRGRLAIALLARSVAAKLEPLHSVLLTNAPERVQYVAWSEFNPSSAARAFIGSLVPEQA